MGVEITHDRSAAPHHAKTSECQRAGHKKRGAGGIPPRLFASGLSLEKAWIPRPGSGGEPRCRSGPAPVQTRPTCQRQTGTAYPSGGCLGSAFGAQRPGGLPARRETYGAGSNLRHPPPSQATPGRTFFVKSFEIHCVFLAIFDKKCYPKNEERETSPEGHRNHRRPQERRGTG